MNQTTAYLYFITAIKRLKTFKVSLLLHRKRLHRRKGAGELLQRAGEVQTRSGHGEGIHTHNRQCHGFTVIFQCYFTLRQVIIWMTLTTGGKQNRTEATVLVCVFLRWNSHFPSSFRSLPRLSSKRSWRSSWPTLTRTLTGGSKCQRWEEQVLDWRLELNYYKNNHNNMFFFVSLYSWPQFCPRRKTSCCVSESSWDPAVNSWLWVDVHQDKTEPDGKKGEKKEAEKERKAARQTERKKKKTKGTEEKTGKWDKKERIKTKE